MVTEHDNSPTDTVGQEEDSTSGWQRGCLDEEFSHSAIPWFSCEPGSELPQLCGLGIMKNFRTQEH